MGGFCPTVGINLDPGNGPGKWGESLRCGWFRGLGESNSTHSGSWGWEKEGAVILSPAPKEPVSWDPGSSGSSEGREIKMQES